MKKIIACIAACCLVATVYAQQDSIGMDTIRKVAPLRLPDPSPANSTAPTLNENSNPYTGNPLIRISVDEVPSSLRKTLEHQRYSGWQHSPVYRDSKTSEYTIGITQGDSIRTFRFDKNGRAIHPDSPDKNDN
jgi:hypothetical protein